MNAHVEVREVESRRQALAIIDSFLRIATFAPDAVLGLNGMSCGGLGDFWRAVCDQLDKTIRDKGWVCLGDVIAFVQSWQPRENTPGDASGNAEECGPSDEQMQAIYNAMANVPRDRVADAVSSIETFGHAVARSGEQPDASAVTGQASGRRKRKRRSTGGATGKKRR